MPKPRVRCLSNGATQVPLKLAKILNRHFFQEAMQLAKKYMKMCSTALVMREMQDTTGYDFIPTWKAIIKKKTNDSKCWKAMEKSESFSIPGPNLKWYSLFETQFSSFSKSLKLPYAPAISFLGKHSKE